MSYVTLNADQDGITATVTSDEQEIKELKLRIKALEDGIGIALQWNWMDDDMPQEYVDSLTKLQEGKG